MKLERIQSKHNDFEHLTDWRNPGGVVWLFALRITCSTCPNFDVVALPKGLSYTCPQPVADGIFGHKGWRLGRNRKNDICPACQAQTKRDRSNRRNTAVLEATLADVMPPSLIALAQQSTPTAAPKEEKIMSAPIALRADAPRTMSRDDKRLIFARLHEVYLDEVRGYMDDWTDKRIAEELGVPQAWIAAVRDEHFGPEKSNEASRKYVEEAKALLKTAVEQRAALNTLAANAAAARDGLGAKIDVLTKKLETLEKAYR